MQVRKRNGQIVNFDRSKIANAVFKALKDTLDSESECEQVSQTIAYLVESRLSDCVEIISVEAIQYEIENILMKSGRYDAARNYIIYRNKHQESRFIQQRLDYMNQYASASSNAATSSETDANANMIMKNVANLEGEVYKTTNRIIQRQRMKNKLHDMFPDVAK